MRLFAVPEKGWLRLVPVTLVMGTIFLLSHQPGDSLPLPEVVNLDKVLHCLAYAVLGLAALFALPPAWRRRHPVKAGMGVVLFCLLYGLTDEAHQSFIPGRFSSGADLLADGLGGLLAVLVTWGWRHRRERSLV